ncbi:MAG TPA: FAD-dependent oxidoreductase [Candidatus Paceibacterota bacterium]|nr:FAD-dependent oxidoreductase [Candidatus Paceibacterota bacterium]
MATKEISTWLATQDLPKYPKLTSDVTCDVTVIGGGLAGLLSAYELAKAGKSVVVLEKDRFFQKGSGFTTGFLTQSIDTDVVDQVPMFGDDGAKQIWNSHGDAINLIERIAKEEKIDCEFTRCINYAYANDRSEERDLDEEFKEMKRLGFSVKMHKEDIGIYARSIMAVRNQAKFHSVKFAAGLLEALGRMGVGLYEQTGVDEIEGDGPLRVSAGRHTVTAEWTAVTTYQPFNNPKEVFLQKGMYITYILELAVPKGKYPEGIYEDMDNPYHYFRVDPGKALGGKDRIVIGGEDHRAELKSRKMEEESYAALEEYVEEIFGKQYPIVRRWSGYILEPIDGLAFIGEYEPKQLLATAFSGTGMTYSAITAMVFRDIVLGQPNSYAELYKPGRTPSLTQLWKKGRDYTEEMFRGAVANAFKQSDN